MLYVSIFVLVLCAMLFCAVCVPFASAHTTVEVEPYEIEVGWAIEPPIVGIRNDFVFKIAEPGMTSGSFMGVKNAFNSLDAVAVFGGATKDIDINSDVRIGYYYSSVIPTRTGSYAIDLKGEINGVAVDVQIPIEDVESTTVLDFPPTSGSSSTQDISSLKNAIQSIQQDISSIKSGSLLTKTPKGVAYDFAVLGLSIASSAIILAVIALVKRK